jgi:hypothetical protein
LSSSDRPGFLASLLAVVALACSTAPPPSTASAPSAASSPSPSSAASPPSWAPHAASGATPARHPVPTTEPPCPSAGDRRFYACGVFHEESLVPEFEAPFETCKITLKGLEFSPAETERHRLQNPGSCCYLQRCRVSMGY